MYNNNNYKHSDITEKIIKAAIAVHKQLGCGFQEVIYQRAMVIEMKKLGLEFGRELTMEIEYDNKTIGSRRVDFLVDGKILVEIKALEKLEDVHQVQLLNYLKVYKLEVGLLINFGAIKQVEIKRMVNTRK
jgi:GxxExxY protein